MALVASENWACIESSDEINTDFLISLMEELQDQVVEQGDEERLNSVIQSLEAEINSTSSDNHQMDGLDWSVSFDDLEMSSECIDMELARPCSPSHYMNLHMYSNGDHELSDSVVGFGGVSIDYLGVTLDLDHEYSSLWQETIGDSVMYE